MDLGKIVQSLVAVVQGIEQNRGQIPDSDIQSAETSLDSVYEKLRRIRSSAEKIRDNKRGSRSLQREPDIQRMNEGEMASDWESVKDIARRMTLKQLLFGVPTKKIPCGQYIEGTYHWKGCMKKQGEKVLRKMEKVAHNPRRTERLAKLYNRIQQQIGSRDRVPIKTDIKVTVQKD